MTDDITIYQGFAAPAADEWLIKVYALKERFTKTERNGFRAAAATNPDIVDMLDLLDSKQGEGVHLQSGIFPLMLAGLVTAGLLMSDRANVIQNTPLTADERQ